VAEFAAQQEVPNVELPFVVEEEVRLAEELRAEERVAER